MQASCLEPAKTPVKYRAPVRALGLRTWARFGRYPKTYSRTMDFRIRSRHVLGTRTATVMIIIVKTLLVTMTRIRIVKS